MEIQMLSVTKTASPGCFDKVRSIGVTVQREWEEGDYKRAREYLKRGGERLQGWESMQGQRDCRVERVCRGREIAGLRQFAWGERLQCWESLQGERDCRVERFCRLRELYGRQRDGYEERERWLGAQERGTEGRKVERKDREAFPSEIHSRYPQLPLPPSIRWIMRGRYQSPDALYNVHISLWWFQDPLAGSMYTYVQQMGIQGPVACSQNPGANY